jgi:hypothetical protein
LDRSGDSGPPCRGSFPDDDPRAVRHHDRPLQHQAHQSDHPAIRHPLTDTVEQALVMNSIEELGAGAAGASVRALCRRL